MDLWDVLILLAAGYIAIMTLVRLMARHRNQLVDQVSKQITGQRGAKPPTEKPVEEGDRGAA